MNRSRRSDSSRQLPLSRAIIAILLSTLLISGSAALGLLYYQHIRELRTRDSAYQLRAIVQSGPSASQIKTVHLAELIGIHAGFSRNLYLFDTKKAKSDLLKTSFITDVEIKKILPDLLFIDYRARKPVARLADFSNTLVDEEGVPFPYLPYFANRSFPEFVLGVQELEWGTPIETKELSLAAKLQREFSSLPIDRIDVSLAYSPSYGQRQIVLVLGDHILRLSTKNYAEEIDSYLSMRDLLPGGESWVVDLRIPQLAFISPID